MLLTAVAGNTFNTSVEGIGLGAGVTGVPASGDHDALFTFIGGQTVSLTDGYVLKDYRSNTIYAPAGVSVQDALDGASSGDTVRLQAGAYTESTLTATVNNVTLFAPSGVTGVTGLSAGSGVTIATLAGAAGLNLTGNALGNTLTGNDGNNTITGGLGDDTIDGGAGTDQAVFSGNYSQYTITFNPSNVTVVGPDGTDTLTNIESLKFDDVEIPLVTVATTMTIAATGITYGQDGVVTVTVARNDSGTPVPSGTVSLVFNSETPALTATLDANGVATFNFPFNTDRLAAGTYTLSATYAAQGLFLASSDTDSLVVSKKALTVTGAVATDRVYDRTTTVVVSGGSLSGLVDGDDASVTLSASGTGTMVTKNAGNNKPVTVTGYSISGSAKDNYELAQPTGLTVNIAAKALTVTGAAATNRAYNGLDTVVVSGGNLDGVISGDAVSLTASGTGTMVNRHVADNKPITVTGYVITGDDATNYALSQPTGLTVNITKKDVTGSFTVADRQYNGQLDVDAPVATRSLVGVVPNVGDTVELVYNGSDSAATYGNGFVGNGKAVTPAAVNPATGWALSGVDAGNYSLSTVANSTGNITQRVLTVTITVNSRPYNGTTTATINTITTDKLPLDDVTVTASSVTFNDKTAGVNKPATATGLSLSGSSFDQYVLSSTTASATGTITKAPLTLNFLVGATKVYDGTDEAIVTSSSLTPAFFLNDQVLVLSTLAKYASKNVGTNIQVTGYGATLGGNDGGNYEVTQYGTTQASITARPVTLTSWTAGDKTYDGSNAAVITGSNFTGGITGETLTLGGTATFASSNAGTHVVTIAGPTLSSSNYSLTNANFSGVAPVSATISPKLLTPLFSASDKFFDGTLDASVSVGPEFGQVAGDDVTITYGSATFASASIDEGVEVTISGISIGGTAFGNYTLGTGGDQQVASANINNNPPVVTASSGSTPYLLQDPPTVIDGSIEVEDFESTFGLNNGNASLASLNGGWLQVDFETEIDAFDTLSIVDQGTDSGQIGYQGGSEVTYGGVVIGTVSGNGTKELRIEFTLEATVVSVQALARRIAFENVDPEASGNPRTVQFQVNDGREGSSNIATKGIFFSTGNEAPVLELSPGATTYTEGTPAVRVDSGISISDPDQLNFAGGEFRVSLGGTASADDRLDILSSATVGEITVDGTSVGIKTADGMLVIGTIGDRTADSSEDIVVALNSDATIANTQLLAQAITFRNVSNNPVTSPRGVTFELSDGRPNNPSSVPVTKTVNVVAVNNAPTIVLDDAYTPVFTEPDVASATDTRALEDSVRIDTGVGISDPDSLNFGGGNLKVTNVTPNNSDRFGITLNLGVTFSTGVIANNNQAATNGASVSVDGTVIGTVFSQNANGLQINFNSSAATVARVEKLMQAINFRCANDLPGSTRNVTFQVTDNAGGASNVVTKALTVVQTNDLPRITNATVSTNPSNNRISLTRNATSTSSPYGTSLTMGLVDPFDLTTNLPTGVPGSMAGATLVFSALRSGSVLTSEAYSLTLDSSYTALSAIGTVTGSGTNELTVTFNANATSALITPLLRALRVRALTGAATGDQLRLVLTELEPTVTGSPAPKNTVTINRYTVIS